MCLLTSTENFKKTRTKAGLSHLVDRGEKMSVEYSVLVILIGALVTLFVHRLLLKHAKKMSSSWHFGIVCVPYLILCLFLVSHITN